jgi:hypothetical protein
VWKSPDVDPAQPMIDWMNNAPPAELAAELMSAFGPDGPRGGDAVSSYDITEWMFRDYPKQTGIFVATRPVNGSISEAVQLLEHSELIYLRWFSNDYPVWSVTRFGTATLAAGKEAVRQRIKDRTGL